MRCAFRSTALACLSRLSSLAASRHFATTNQANSNAKPARPVRARIVICGGGAAGLSAAYWASKTLAAAHKQRKNSRTKSARSSDADGVDVLVLERMSECGKKILMSGGSRCNILPARINLDQSLQITPPAAPSSTSAPASPTSSSHSHGDVSSPDYFTCSSRERMLQIFSSWSVDQCHKWLSSELGLKLTLEEASNKWFPDSNNAKQVRDSLLQKAIQCGAQVRVNSKVDSIKKTKQGTWLCSIQDGVDVEADMVIVSAGGFSFPLVGTDGMGYAWARRLGHTLHAPFAALTSLRGPHPNNEPLPGVSLECSVKVEHHDTHHTLVNPRTGFLFTHRGFSGPAILDVSHNAVLAMDLAKELAPPSSPSSSSSSSLSELPLSLVVAWDASCPSESEWKRRLQQGGQTSLVNRIAHFLPVRLVKALLMEAKVVTSSNSGSVRWSDLESAQQQRVLQLLTKYKLKLDGHDGYRKAEVTGGGVRLEDVDPTTMESLVSEIPMPVRKNKASATADGTATQAEENPKRSCAGLFFCGEVLDVFGRIGGFNFYWAWVSGRLAGKSAAEKLVRSMSLPSIR